MIFNGRTRCERSTIRLSRSDAAHDHVAESDPFVAEPEVAEEDDGAGPRHPAHSMTSTAGWAQDAAVASARSPGGPLCQAAAVTLDGRVAAVTGAGSGIGRGMAVALAAAGARVVANDVEVDGLDETLRLVRDAGSEGVACPGDVRARVDVQRVVDTPRPSDSADST